MQTTNYQAIKIKPQQSLKIEDVLVVEAPLQININKEPYTVVMRTPANDIELIRGLLFAEDIYKNNINFSSETIEEKDSFSTIININIPKEKLGKGYLNKRTLLSVSSCGICGKQKLSDIEISGNALQNTLQFSQEEIEIMFLKMKELQTTFHASGGSHAAAIFDKNKEILTTKEDIGRHNAVDKCVGSLLITHLTQE